MSRVSPIFLLALVVLAGLDLLSAGALWRSIFQDFEDSSGEIASRVPMAVEQTSVAPSPAIPSIEAFSEILARPVFWKTRAPWRSPTASAAPAPPVAMLHPEPSQGMKLQAVVVTSRDRQALIASSQQPQGSWIRQGEMFGGWLVSEIGFSSATLKQSDTELSLTLFPTNQNVNR